MTTLFKHTSPAQAFYWFADTFQGKLPSALDDATVAFFNASCAVESFDTKTIAQYINENLNADFLDVLAICYVIDNPLQLHALQSANIKVLQAVEADMKRAYEYKELFGDSFQGDMQYALDRVIAKLDLKRRNLKKNIYQIKSIMSLFKSIAV